MDTQSFITLYKAISDIYPYPLTQLPRYQSLISLYESLYKEKPLYIARAPGRVNLIGEHIDYSGFGVFPFALEQDTLILFSPNESKTISIQHKDPVTFKPIILSKDPNELPPNGQEYYNYILAGYKSIIIPNKVVNPVGINLLVDGNVPIAAGLSSSASIVVCSAVMTLMANGLREKVPLELFTNEVIFYERTLGPSVGGMDQTISVMGCKNKASFISFDPIRAETIELPKGFVYVIGDSLTESKKVLTFGTRYNKRVCECYIGVLLIKKALGINKDVIMKNLSELQSFLKKSFEEMIELVEKHIKKGGYTVRELEELLEETLEVILSFIPNSQVVLTSNTHYFPYERAFHVYNEAQRVMLFKKTCQDPLLSNEDKGVLMGALMDQSHYSLRDLFDCSSENLETLTSLAKGFGAVGSRLTGAGWGGCMISMVRENDLEGFMQKVKEGFYDGKALGGRRMEEVLFATRPGSGAGVLEVNKL